MLNQFQLAEATKAVPHHQAASTDFDEPASQFYKLHKELDALVLAAFGFEAGDDLLERLLALNLELAEREKAGEVLVGPWDPSGE